MEDNIDQKFKHIVAARKNAEEKTKLIKRRVKKLPEVITGILYNSDPENKFNITGGLNDNIIEKIKESY